mgnify:CR=1 FL=1
MQLCIKAMPGGSGVIRITEHHQLFGVQFTRLEGVELIGLPKQHQHAQFHQGSNRQQQIWIGDQIADP